MKIGIEIHQRLDTKKLFCNCNSEILESENYNFLINRKLHPVFSELGELDLASKSESQKDLDFYYHIFSRCNCLVDCDEEPPHHVNENALLIAIEMSILLHSNLVCESHVMRKIVIDGSNTSGFQRTMIIALGGFIETSRGKIGITSIALEEESAGIVEKNKQSSTYKLDRLGIPLLEITTEPEIIDGEHLKEVAEKIGALLRSTGKVMRGIGTIRQDVNVSTEGGSRIEIKGAQELKLLPEFVLNEVKRQEELIKINKKIKQILKNSSLTFTPKDITSIFKETNSKLISSGIKAGNKVLGIKLSGYSGILGIEIGKNRRYGSELSDYAKTTGVKGIIHSDETLSKYSISEKEIMQIREILEISDSDAFVLVVADEKIGILALKNVFERAMVITIPEETRKANPDGYSTYMRPLPGKERMYPETDIFPIDIPESLVDSVKSKMSLSLDDKRKNLEKILNKEMAGVILKSKNLALFEKFISLGFEPMVVATTLENTLVSIRREGIDFLNLEMLLTELFQEYTSGKFVKSAIPDILLLMGRGFSLNQILEEHKLSKLEDDELEKIAIKYNYDISKIMKDYRLRIEPKDILELKKKK
ncbi:MAG: Glu-tRNA(Gln) amidotransferase subunit GatE [Candidatus ainarchaeum sp.]|nr:Glu-tRNA(Gln) amidotransferase subunit GatE [Candidatus ainarchaeum sp.]